MNACEKSPHPVSIRLIRKLAGKLINAGADAEILDALYIAMRLMQVGQSRLAIACADSAGIDLLHIAQLNAERIAQGLERKAQKLRSNWHACVDALDKFKMEEPHTPLAMTTNRQMSRTTHDSNGDKLRKDLVEYVLPANARPAILQSKQPNLVQSVAKFKDDGRSFYSFNKPRPRYRDGKEVR